MEPGRAGGSPEPPVQVSIIMPVHNSECWLDECLQSVWEQDFKGTMELSIFNDASKDGSAEIIEKWKNKLEEVGVSVIVGNNNSSQPRGVGFARNQAVIQSSGTYLCFLDSDDVMMPQRVRLQHEVAIQHPNSFICRALLVPPLLSMFETDQCVLPGPVPASTACGGSFNRRINSYNSY